MPRLALTRLFRRLARGRPIVVVSGLPRSGTSLAMQMLAAGGLPLLSDGVRGPDAANPRGYFELECVKTLATGGDTAWLAAARGKGVKIVSPLLTHLPESCDYAVVFMRRDLDEVLASQNAMLDARGEPRGADDIRMRAHYDRHLEQVERFLQRRACFSTLMVRYAEVVTAPQAQAARLNAFLGGRLDVGRMAAAAQPSLHRHRRTTVAS